MNEEFLDIVVFIETGRDRKKISRTIGWMKFEAGKARGVIHMTPSHDWDGSFVVEPRREQR